MKLLWQFFKIFNPFSYFILNVGFYSILTFFLSYLRKGDLWYVVIFLFLSLMILLMRTFFELKLRKKEIVTLLILGFPLVFIPLMKIVEKFFYAVFTVLLLVICNIKFHFLLSLWLKSILDIFIIDSCLVLFLFTPKVLFYNPKECNYGN